MTKDQIRQARERISSLHDDIDNLSKIDLGAFIKQSGLVSVDLKNALVEIERLNRRLEEKKRVEGQLLKKIDNQIGDLEKVDKKLSEALEKIASAPKGQSAVMAEVSDERKKELIREYLKTPEGRKKLADSIKQPLRGRDPLSRRYPADSLEEHETED